MLVKMGQAQAFQGVLESPKCWDANTALGIHETINRLWSDPSMQCHNSWKVPHWTSGSGMLFHWSPLVWGSSFLAWWWYDSPRAGGMNSNFVRQSYLYMYM